MGAGKILLTHHLQISISWSIALFVPDIIDMFGDLCWNLEVDPLGAQKKVLDLASSLGIHITVSVAYQVSPTESGG